MYESICVPDNCEQYCNITCSQAVARIVLRNLTAYMGMETVRHCMSPKEASHSLQTVENTAKVEQSMGSQTHVIHIYSKSAELNKGTATAIISCLWASSTVHAFCLLSWLAVRTVSIDLTVSNRRYRPFSATFETNSSTYYDSSMQWAAWHNPTWLHIVPKILSLIQALYQAVLIWACASLGTCTSHALCQDLWQN